jgi:hypothetical protein
VLKRLFPSEKEQVWELTASLRSNRPQNNRVVTEEAPAYGLHQRRPDRATPPIQDPSGRERDRSRERNWVPRSDRIRDSKKGALRDREKPWPPPPAGVAAITVMAVDEGSKERNRSRERDWVPTSDERTRDTSGRERDRIRDRDRSRERSWQPPIAGDGAAAVQPASRSRIWWRIFFAEQCAIPAVRAERYALRASMMPGFDTTESTLRELTDQKLKKLGVGDLDLTQVMAHLQTRLALPSGSYSEYTSRMQWIAAAEAAAEKMAKFNAARSRSRTRSRSEERQEEGSKARVSWVGVRDRQSHATDGFGFPSPGELRVYGERGLERKQRRDSFGAIPARSRSRSRSRSRERERQNPFKPSSRRDRPKDNANSTGDLFGGY